MEDCSKITSNSLNYLFNSVNFPVDFKIKNLMEGEVDSELFNNISKSIFISEVTSLTFDSEKLLFEPSVIKNFFQSSSFTN